MPCRRCDAIIAAIIFISIFPLSFDFASPPPCRLSIIAFTLFSLMLRHLLIFLHCQRRHYAMSYADIFCRRQRAAIITPLRHCHYCRYYAIIFHDSFHFRH
jgi:hypothetical protein